MRGHRVAVDSSGALALDDVRDHGVRDSADISALAARDARSASVLVWNYHDDDLPAAGAGITLTIDGLPDGRATLTHFRIDSDHSNAYTVWKAQGSPQSPTAAERDALIKAGQLETLGAPQPVVIAHGRGVVTFDLPRQGVSLLRFDW
jgi:xylan 1,4-beta-xylosidase